MESTISTVPVPEWPGIGIMDQPGLAMYAAMLKEVGATDAWVQVKTIVTKDTTYEVAKLQISVPQSARLNVLEAMVTAMADFPDDVQIAAGPEGATIYSLWWA